MEIVAAVARQGASAFSLETVELDSPRPDEILVRIVATGLCRSDLVAKTGALPGVTLPMVLGHEGAGIVEQVGAKVTKVKPGDHVVITFLSCGDCPTCSKGAPAYCHHIIPLNLSGRRTDGTSAIRAGEEILSSSFFGQSSFATHALVYERNVVVVDPSLTLEILAPLGCGVQTGVGAILRSLNCRPGSSLLILGGGAVGLSAVMGAVHRGCNPVIVVEPVAERRSVALSLGATHVLDPEDIAGLSEAVRAITPSGVDYVFDTTGITALQSAAVGVMALLGVMGVVGAAKPGAPAPGEMSTIIRQGLTIRGILEGDSDPDIFIPELIDMHVAGSLPLERLITTYPFDRINEAIRDQELGKCIKIVLQMDS